MTTKKYVMLVDSERCVNCKACVTSCRAEWNTPLGYSRNWVREIESIDEYGMPQLSFLSGRCMHCDNPPCVSSCPVGALYKREDGIVLVDRDLCNGCEYCIDACPFDAPFLDPTDGMISKCTFCQPRIDAGQEPACVDVCFTRALIFGDANDPDSEVSKRLKEGAWRSLVTATMDIGPNLYYSENTPFDATVLPGERHVSVAASALEKVVNPQFKIGMGGMVSLLGLAGIIRLGKRKQEVAGQD